MNKIFISFILSTLLLVFFFASIDSYSQSQTTPSTVIELDLAQFVASEQVHCNNPPFKWHAIDHMVLHDIDGEVCAFAFLFAKSDSAFKTQEDLRRHILEKSTLLNHAQEENAEANPDSRIEGVTPDSLVEAEGALYAFSDLATVITGAVSDSPLIQRHFRGIPEFWIQAETLDASTTKRLYGTALARVSSVIMITPMDFRLAASEDSQPGNKSAALQTFGKSTLPPTAHIINMNSKKTQTLGSVKAEWQAIEDQKRLRFNTLEPAKRAQYEKALKDRAVALADEWQKKRVAWQETQNRGGAAQ